MSDAMFKRMQQTRIHNLEQELKKYEWISVKDRLPEKYVKVLVYTECKNIIIASIVNSVVKANVKHIIIWEDSYGYHLEESVTHWMPLPEPPESEDDE